MEVLVCVVGIVAVVAIVFGRDLEVKFRNFILKIRAKAKDKNRR